MDRNQNLWKKAKELIPGNSLLSKRPDMFLPDVGQLILVKFRGCRLRLERPKYLDTIGVLEQIFLLFT